MTAPTPKRRGHPGTAPWQSLPSQRAGLPGDRAAWLAVVLPAIDAGRSHPEVAKLLTDAGHQVTGSSVRLWHLKLEAMRAAGQLPEHPGAFPTRDPGWHEGAPVPSPEKAAEGGRKGAETKARAKGPGKGKRAGRGRGRAGRSDGRSD